MHVQPRHLNEVVKALGHVLNVDGALVTVPHKIAALGLCARATERARFARSANVLRKETEGWFGDNTDGQGFVDGIERAGFAVAGRSALLVGCGGAGSAIALELLERGVALLAIHDTDTIRRDTAIARLSARFPGRVAADSRYAGAELPPRGSPISAWCSSLSTSSRTRPCSTPRADSRIRRIVAQASGC